MAKKIVSWHREATLRFTHCPSLSEEKIREVILAHLGDEADGVPVAIQEIDIVHAGRVTIGWQITAWSPPERPQDANQLMNLADAIANSLLVSSNLPYIFVSCEGSTRKLFK